MLRYMKWWAGIIVILVGMIGFVEAQSFVMQSSRWNFTVTEMRWVSEAGNRRPSNDYYFVAIGELTNRSNRRQCAKSDLNELVLGSFTYQMTADMEALKSVIGLDYMGTWRGQCIDAGATQPTFIAFDVRYIADTNMSLWFDGMEQKLALGNNNTSNQVTATPTPQPTIAQQYTTNLTSSANSAQTGNIRATPIHANPVTRYIVGFSNVRSCERTNCDVVQQLYAGNTVQTLQRIKGEFVNNSDQWWQIDLNGQTAYVHSSLVTDVRPASQTVTNNSPANVPATTNNNNFSQFTQPAYSPPVNNAVIGGGMTCPYTSAPRCADITCDEAYACMGTFPRLDGNNDGVPCEEYCTRR